MAESATSKVRRSPCGGGVSRGDYNMTNRGDPTGAQTENAADTSTAVNDRRTRITAKRKRKTWQS